MGEQCKKFDEEKELADRELQSQIEKEDEKRQRLEMPRLVDIWSKEKRRLQEESREKNHVRIGESSHT